MKPLTSHLVLAVDATIDLQMHTTSSDGTWTPEQLIDYLVSEQFDLVALKCFFDERSYNVRYK